MTEWTPKQHIEHQELMRKMERERNESPAPEPVIRKKRKKKTARKQRSM